jgi:hypothetical protein
MQASSALAVATFSLNAKGVGILSGAGDANSTISVYDTSTGKALGSSATATNGAWSVAMGGLSNTVHGFGVTENSSSGAISTSVVVGSTGNDTISIAGSNETIFGNGGSNSFAFSGSFGKATVEDFQTTADSVQVDHGIFTSVADALAHATQSGVDVTITASATDAIILHNVSMSQLTANNFHIV